MSTKIQGQFVWYELTTHDTQAAESFYRQLVDWKAETGSPAGIPYTVFSRERSTAAGMMALPEELKALGVPPNWMPYIAPADVADVVARLRELGGSVQREPWRIEAMDMTLAVVADPQGAAFAILHSGASSSS